MFEFLKRHKHHKKEIEVIFIEEKEIIIIEEDHYHKRKKLAAQYSFCNYKILTTMATINLDGTQSKVAEQLVPLAADGSVQPITAIQAGTESYSSSDSSIATAAADPSAEGAFVITRVADAGGTVTVTYSATNANGDTITGSDDFILAAVVVAPPLATSLTATFGSPS